MTDRPASTGQPATWLDRRLSALLPGLSLRLRDLIGFLVVIVLVQAAFWAFYASPLWPKPATPDLDRIAFTETTLARLPKPTAVAAAQARYQPVELPHTECCEPVYLALKLRFDLAAVPAEGLGLAAYQQVDNFVVQVNGSTISSRGEMTFPHQTFEGQRPLVERIPAGLLKVGSNELLFITVRQGMPYSDLVAPILGPWASVAQWAEVRMWRTVDYRQLSGLTTAIIGLFALMLAFRAPENRFALWLALLGGAWTAYVLYGLVLDPPFGGLMRLWLFFVVNALTAISLAGLIDAWTERPWPRFQLVLIGVFLAFVSFCAVWLWTRPMPGGYDAPALAWVWLSVALGVAVVVRLIWHFATTPEPRRLEAALLAICATCVVMDAIGEHFGLTPGGFLLDSTPLLLLALVAAFLQRNFTLFRSAVSLNALLADRLAVREAELETAHARERELVRSQAHDDERRRIMRDMHDGLGSQLMSMLLAARRGKAEPAAVAEGLQAVIDEMRLMIDSMDSVGESLASALTTFEDRVRPRIEEAGFVLVWSSLVETRLPDYPPRVVLQVFRILQEAVTNALKHSGGNRIEIVVAPGAEDDTVRLTVSDNGRGLAARGPSGHGLRNMQSRAALVGATVEIQDAGTGTHVVLILRLPRKDP
ncbi:MAG: ATP-binding protein [Brevundimonas sp.]|uniref:ATP-binding protein n=1 Tax=Brevundimonas sp. TaxID=1871086 RepID=UPI002736A886|nr:ATP-binding protein [Brevundimonas sp.]MDP3405241.1 ATP-binding protein [Brevundimonas sp.]